jgi:hypothetical protein
MVMLNQARAFAEHDPHGALGRIDEVLGEVDAEIAADPSLGATAREVRRRAESLRVTCGQAYARFQAAAAQRADAYRARIQREITKAG